MAPINDGIPHVHNHPGSKMTNLPEANVHDSKRPYDAVRAIANNSRRALSFGNTATNDNPPPAPTSPATYGHEGNDADSTPLDPDNTNDSDMSTLEKMLTPPESDTEPQLNGQDVKVFYGQCQPHIRVDPFYPQPPNPFKEQKGASNRRRNEINKRLRRARTTRSNNVTGNGNLSSGNGSDGDDEDVDDHDNDSPHGPNAEAYNLPKPTCSIAVSHGNPPTTPRRVLRSQDPGSDSDSQTVSPRTLAPTPKRNRDDSKTDVATPTRGQRVSKRRRNSRGDSPLPPMPPVKRTRAEQKKFESKLDHLIFDPERPGSVEREVVEVKSGAKEWRMASLHEKPWDGNSKFE